MRFSLILLSFLIATASAGHANTVRWTLNGGFFEDGAAVTGFFDWDAPSNTITGFEFAVEAAPNDPTSPFTAFTYDSDLGDTGTYIETSFFDGEEFIQFVTQRDRIPLPPNSDPQLLRELRLGLPNVFNQDILDTPAPRFDLPFTLRFTNSGLAECFNCNPYRGGLSQGVSVGADPFLSGAALVAAPIPLPASVWMLAVALVGAGAFVRRRG